MVARVISNTDAATLQDFVRGALSTKVDLLTTDEHASYAGLTKDLPHSFVRHSRGEYVIGAVHT